jgi:cation transport ATPase
VVASAAIPLGLIAQADGTPQAGSAVWAAATALTLLPLAFSVLRSLRNRALGVDIITFLAMLGALVFHEYLAAWESRAEKSRNGFFGSIILR